MKIKVGLCFGTLSGEAGRGRMGGVVRVKPPEDYYQEKTGRKNSIFTGYISPSHQKCDNDTFKEDGISHVIVTIHPVAACPARSVYDLPGNCRELYSRSPLLYR